jgi:septum formation protein
MVVLASGSPRRRELMQLMGFKDVLIRVSGFSENLDKAAYPSAADYCLATAVEKAKDVVLLLTKDAPSENLVVISADTIVEVDNKVLEKPSDVDEAHKMLAMLSGNYHTVHTGVAIIAPRKDSSSSEHCIRSFIQSTRVKFDTLSQQDIDAYIATGEPFDKAGGYGIQGVGGQLVESIEGCYFNVMGLPIHSLSKTLAAMHSQGHI